MATGRRIRRCHGRRRGRDRRVDRRRGARLGCGAVVRSAAADARRGAVDRLLRVAPGRDGAGARRLRALRRGRGAGARRARTCLHDVDRRGCVCVADRRGARPSGLRPVVARRRRHRRRGDVEPPQGRPGRRDAERDAPGRLRRVRDGRDGVRRARQGRGAGRVPAGGWGDGHQRGPHPVPVTGRRRARLARPEGSGPARLPRRSRTHHGHVPDRRRRACRGAGRPRASAPGRIAVPGRP